MPRYSAFRRIKGQFYYKKHNDVMRKSLQVQVQSMGTRYIQVYFIENYKFFLSLWCVTRYLKFSTYNFDFFIFFFTKKPPPPPKPCFFPQAEFYLQTFL